jgi:hypothetical protein
VGILIDIFLGIAGGALIFAAYLAGKYFGKETQTNEKKQEVEKPTEEQVREAKRAAKQLENFYSYDGYTAQSDDV